MWRGCDSIRPVKKKFEKFFRKFCALKVYERFAVVEDVLRARTDFFVERFFGFAVVGRFRVTGFRVTGFRVTGFRVTGFGTTEEGTTEEGTTEEGTEEGTTELGTELATGGTVVGAASRPSGCW
jgi:hypothetical protein